MCKDNLNPYYSSSNFSIAVSQKKYSTTLLFTVYNGIINTGSIKHTLPFLKTYKPSVLETECFNTLNLPFSIEVINTELGHLFEHILLDELIRLKKQNVLGDAVYNGETSWDFKKMGHGVFYVWVDSGHSEEPLFHTALNNTIRMFEMLLSASNEDVRILSQQVTGF